MKVYYQIMPFYLLIIVALAILPYGYVLALNDDYKWTDVLELSFVKTGGNSDTTSLAGKNFLDLKSKTKFEGSWEIGLLYGRTTGVTNIEKYNTEVHLSYNIFQGIYSGIIVGWAKDRFAGIRDRFNLGPAIGHKSLEGPYHFLKEELGFNLVKEKYTEDKPDDDFVEAFIALTYEYHFQNKNRFVQMLKYSHDFEDTENYNIFSETAIIMTLSDQFSFKTSFEIKYDNQPAASNLKKSDSILKVAFLSNF